MEIKPFLESINSGSRKLISVLDNPHRKGQSSPMVMAITFKSITLAVGLLKEMLDVYGCYEGGEGFRQLGIGEMCFQSKVV